MTLQLQFRSLSFKMKFQNVVYDFDLTATDDHDFIT